LLLAAKDGCRLPKRLYVDLAHSPVRTCRNHNYTP
jgi:hypothetical protein